MEFYISDHEYGTFTMEHFKTYAQNSDRARWANRSSVVKTFYR